MINKLKTLLKSKKFIVVLFCAIVLSQLAHITYIFTTVKTGYGSDEIWSYGLSNSYYKPFIHASDHDITESYINGWFTGEDFSEYVTVQDGQQFSYGSVWYNQSKDVHPPLFYAVMHTICSFFPDTFSLWYGYSINVVTFIITQILIFKIAKKVSKSTVTAFATIILWGFSLGANSLYIYIRMYTMSVMFMVILLYINTLIYEAGKFSKKYVIPLVVVTMLGGLTHYYFYISACVLSVLFCIWFIAKKQFKNLFAYGFSMLGGVALAIAVFPSAIGHMLGGKDLINMPGSIPFVLEFPLMLNQLLPELFGFSVPIFYKGQHAYILTALVILAIVVIPLSFLFRNEVWFKNYLAKLKTLCKATKVRLIATFKKFNWMLLFIFIDVLVTIMIEATQVSQFFGITQRYEWIVYPIACIFFVSFAHYIVSWLPQLKHYTDYLILIVAIVCPILSNIKCHNDFIFDREIETTAMEDIVDGSNCIFMVGDVWSITCYDFYLFNANNVYVAGYYNSCDSFENYTDEYLKLKDDEKFYIIIDTSQLKSEPSDDDDSTTTSYSGTTTTGIVMDNELKDVGSENYPTLNELLDYFKGIFPDKTITKVSSEHDFDHITNIYEVS